MRVKVGVRVRVRTAPTPNPAPTTSPLTSFYFALVRRFKTSGSPRNLTIVSHGGNGGKGKLPGSLDDVLALPGLVSA